MSTTYSVNCIQCQLHTVSTAHSVNCIQCQLHTVSTTYSVNCIQCQLHTVSTAHSVNYIQCQLHTVSTTYSVNYILQCQPHTVSTKYSVNYTLIVIYTHSCIVRGWIDDNIIEASLNHILVVKQIQGLPYAGRQPFDVLLEAAVCPSRICYSL